MEFFLELFPGDFLAGSSLDQGPFFRIQLLQCLAEFFFLEGPGEIFLVGGFSFQGVHLLLQPVPSGLLPDIVRQQVG